MKRIILFLAICIVSIPNHVSGADDPYASRRAYEGQLYDTIVYDPHSKSYFELVKRQAGFSDAWQFARTRSFKGVRGHLATIRSRETWEFLLQTLRPRGNETWIGLRMACRGRTLIWVDGKKLDRRKDYANWGSAWHYKREYRPCKGRDAYGGVVLNTLQRAGYSGKAIKWFVIEPGHGVMDMLIEYPTRGKRE